MGEYNLKLEDRLYTSTEVAEILGVSLRSVYRYLEDEKLIAEMKTATGRHRFTKQNILDFLYPDRDMKVESEEDKKEERKVEKEESQKEKEVEETQEEDTEEEEVVVEEEEEPEDEEKEDEEEVDWLSKFRKAAEKYKAESKEEDEEKEDEEEVEDKEEVSGLTDAEEEDEDEEVEEEPEESNEYYYTSKAGGLKDVAQKLDKSAKKASLDYAFTMHAGMSLHKPINPFSLIHSYVRSEDLPFFEKILDLEETKKKEAQLCLIVSDDSNIYDDVVEMHGLNVVSDDRLAEDLESIGEEDLASDLR